MSPSFTSSIAFSSVRRGPIVSETTLDVVPSRVSSPFTGSTYQFLPVCLSMGSRISRRMSAMLLASIESGGTNVSAQSIRAARALRFSGEYNSVQTRYSFGTAMTVPVTRSKHSPITSSTHLRSSSSKNACMGTAAAPNISR